VRDGWGTRFVVVVGRRTKDNSGASSDASQFSQASVLLPR
jgi:hypothetical protein